jgi:hypothetical protein
MITVKGLPETAGRYYLPELAFDSNWHQVSLVVNQGADYWAVYIDGQEIIRKIFFANLPIFSQVEMSDDNGSAVFDELIFWNRPLSSSEVLNDYLLGAPYAPEEEREPQKVAKLIHSWDFTEDTGSTAQDSLSSSILNIDSSSWTGHSHNNYALALFNGQNYVLNFDNPLISQDLSLAFWWRNVSHSNEGRSNVYLTGGEGGEYNILALMASDYRLGYWFNNEHGVLTEGLDEGIPNDGLWHHLALIYDSYRYKLNFYVDGEIAADASLVRLKDGEEISGLRINDDNFNSAIDDLNIYSGVLSPNQVKELYLSTK